MDNASNKIPSDSIYHIDNNSVRSVVPYLFEFSTHAKGRWIGRTLIDIVVGEFGGLGYDSEFWHGAIANGHIRINKSIVGLDYVMNNSDYLTRKTHRHEPPIYGNVEYIGQNDTMFAVCKPASLPMHACGAYNHNSLSMIIKHDFKDMLPLHTKHNTQLHQVHRLDRVTSGVVVMAKDKKSANTLAEQIRSRQCRKVSNKLYITIWCICMYV